MPGRLLLRSSEAGGLMDRSVVVKQRSAGGAVLYKR
jgi:hypothetical protein